MTATIHLSIRALIKQGACAERYKLRMYRTELVSASHQVVLGTKNVWNLSICFIVIFWL